MGDISISGTLEQVRIIFSSVGFTLLTVNFICHWMWVCIFKLLENFPNPRMLSACLLCLQRSGKSSAESVLELKKIQKGDASSTPVEKCNEGCQRHWLFTYSICQNPDVMSNLWNTAVPSSCARVPSTTGSTCGFFMLLLNVVRSTHVLILPLGIRMAAVSHLGNYFVYKC